jgi:hypothetical protein
MVVGSVDMQTVEALNFQRYRKILTIAISASKHKITVENR